MQVTPAKASRIILGRLLDTPELQKKSGLGLWSEVLQVEKAHAGRRLLDLLWMMQTAAKDLETIASENGEGLSAAKSIYACCQQLLQSGLNENGEQLVERVSKTAAMLSLEIADLRLQMANLGLAPGLSVEAAESISKLDEIRAEIDSLRGLDDIHKRNLRVVLAHVQDALRQYGELGWGAVDVALLELLAFLRQNYPEDLKAASRSDGEVTVFSRLAKFAVKRYTDFHIAKPILAQLPAPAEALGTAKNLLDHFG